MKLCAACCCFPYFSLLLSIFIHLFVFVDDGVSHCTLAVVYEKLSGARQVRVNTTEIYYNNQPKAQATCIFFVLRGKRKNMKKNEKATQRKESLLRNHLIFLYTMKHHWCRCFCNTLYDSQSHQCGWMSVSWLVIIIIIVAVLYTFRSYGGVRDDGKKRSARDRQR